MQIESALRRRHAAELKARVLAACDEPGGSVAAIAGEFIALALPGRQAVSAAPADIRIELHRGATSTAVIWPLAAADLCAAWLRGWLR